MLESFQTVEKTTSTRNYSMLFLVSTWLFLLFTHSECSLDFFLDRGGVFGWMFGDVWFAFVLLVFLEGCRRQNIQNCVFTGLITPFFPLNASFCFVMDGQNHDAVTWSRMIFFFWNCYLQIHLWSTVVWLVPFVPVHDWVIQWKFLRTRSCSNRHCYWHDIDVR